ncbi:MAG: thioredoxin family protein, partial [Thermodesulfobacteriota bacterium]
AKQEQKKVFLYFYTDWCRYCKMMSDNTFVDKKVVAMLNRDFVPIQVNSDKFREVAAKYKVRPVPVSFFLEAGGQEIGSRPGYLQPDAFLRLLEFVKAEGYKP